MFDGNTPAVATSQLGPVALATQSVLLVSSSTTYQAPYAVSVATSVRYANLLTPYADFWVNADTYQGLATSLVVVNRRRRSFPAMYHYV